MANRKRVIIEVSRRGRPGDVTQSDLAVFVPPIVDQRLSESDAPAQAAALAAEAAVDAEISTRSLTEMQPVEIGEDIAYAKTFSDGKRTFMEMQSDGAPTPWSATLIEEALLNNGMEFGDPAPPPTVGTALIRTAILGDSMASGDSAHSREAWGWANLLSHGTLVRSGNGWSAGIGGEVTSQILARVGDVTGLLPKPHLCIVQGGTNDVLTSVPVATTKSNLVAMYDALEAAGIEPIACLIPPSDTQPTRVVILNAWIAAYAAYRGLRCLDNYSENADPDGTWRTGYSGDGTHPNATSARLMGERVVRALAPNASAEHLLAGFTGADTTNLIVNGTFTGDTSGDGVADHWGLNTPGSHVTTALVPGDGSVIGNWQKVTKTAAGNNYITPAVAITAGFSAGDVMLFAGRVRLASVDSYGIGLWVHDNALAVDNILFQWTGDLTGEDGAIFTHMFVVPSGTTSFSPRISASVSTGTGSYSIAQWTLRNLTTMGVV